MLVVVSLVTSDGCSLKCRRVNYLPGSVGFRLHLQPIPNPLFAGHENTVPVAA